MNQIQRAIATVTGIDEVLRAQESELGEVLGAMEHLASDNQMMQRQIEDLDYLNLFDNNQIMEVLPTRDRRNTLARLRRLRHDNPLAKQAVKLVVRFTLGKGVQWVLAAEPDTTTNEPPVGGPVPAPEPKQTSGGPIVPTKLVQLPRTARSGQEQVLDTASDPIRDILKSFWDDPDNQLAFTTHKSMQQMLDDILTDGEKFYSCFEGTAEPYVKVSEIPVEEITQIIYDPDNRLKPVFYKRQFQKQIYDGTAEMYKPDGNPITRYYYDYRIKEEDKADLLKRIRVPKSKIDPDATIRHEMINEIWTKSGKRGISELYASREWFRVFREFMEGRAAINTAAQSISFSRKIKGSPSAVARFSNKLGGLSVGDSPDNAASEVRKLTKPLAGAVYDSNEAVDLEWMKTDTGAQNAKEDARLLLMSAGAGVGTMAHYFGEGGDANLATAQSMELPMVKSYEDWQQFIEDFFLGWFKYVLSVANGDSETAAEDAEAAIGRVGFTFPPIISQDVVKYTTSWSQIVRDIAPNNMVVKKEAIRSVLAVMQVPNIDGLMPQIEAQMAAAEALRIEQQRAMAEAFANAPAPNPGGPPSGGLRALPNEGQDPNTKALVKGNVKAANGPKPA